MMETCIDLNCDLGEYDLLSQGKNDTAIMPFISSCNIAAGVHAGNQAVIEQTVDLALKHQVNIGAHPSYPDRENFGRKVMIMPAMELKPIFKAQIQLVKAVAEQQGGQLSHVKPHGALYNQAAIDFDLAQVLMETVAEIDSKLMFYGLAHSAMEQAAIQSGLKFIAEGFADRAYTHERTLAPRTESGAVIDDPIVMLNRVLQMLKQQTITTTDGVVIKLNIKTLCLHGDHKNSVQTAQVLSQGLKQAGFNVQAPHICY
jgi:UPF0271 protein